MEDEHAIPDDLRGLVLAKALTELQLRAMRGWTIELGEHGQLRLLPPTEQLDSH